METFTTIVQLILSLSILVVLHELGHFIPAKLFKTRVEKFYLFFNPWFSLFKFKKGETEYGIGWLPLGGFVKISGMIDESMDTDQMKGEPKPWEFRSKPVWQRLIIMIGGVVVNFILAIVIYSMITFVWGKNHIKNDDLKHGLVVHEMFQEFGFKNGDKVLTIDGKETFDATDISQHLFLRDVKEVEVLHKNGTKETLQIPDGIEYKMFKKRVVNNAFTPRVVLPFIDSVIPNGNADKIGLSKGDKIIKLENQNFTYFDELKKVEYRKEIEHLINNESDEEYDLYQMLNSDETEQEHNLFDKQEVVQDENDNNIQDFLSKNKSNSTVKNQKLKEPNIRRKENNEFDDFVEGGKFVKAN